MEFEPTHYKTYIKTCATSKDTSACTSTQYSKGLVYPSLESLEAQEDTCDQRRLWSDCADAQADLSLCWSHKSKCRF